MTGKLDRLEEQGVIQRSSDPDDWRAVRLVVTEAGRELIDNAFASSLQTFESMLDHLTREETEDLPDLLEKVLSRLDDLS
ncbi:MAG: MarR family transcriptional regulator, partial [Acidimicrobiia bacterium]|nr:MarR family transcriptional regulator [Acidimicrobiia bacterium]